MYISEWNWLRDIYLFSTRQSGSQTAKTDTIAYVSYWVCCTHTVHSTLYASCCAHFAFSSSLGTSTKNACLVVFSPLCIYIRIYVCKVPWVKLFHFCMSTKREKNGKTIDEPTTIIYTTYCICRQMKQLVCNCVSFSLSLLCLLRSEIWVENNGLITFHTENKVEQEFL